MRISRNDLVMQLLPNFDIDLSNIAQKIGTSLLDIHILYQ
jgi:hypothetical protein